MSNTIDQRVVEMRFDNRNFEQNVSHTMSTLDKFKAKLNLSDATKGFGNLSTAAKQVDMNGLASGVETVRARFSALEVIGVTALARITNQAMATGERMIKALTIDPVKTGFQEYETQINATQTILSNTKSKGSTIDDVNDALRELNDYADMTIYNFTEMTRNIGTFTAAGIDLDTSVNAIQGIANLAAVSGSTSQQASTAMYQLSQALAAGTVKLMDWNSVVNAGMGGEMFQNALKETSELLGTGAEAAIKAEGSFRESLRKGWLTSEVLTETLKKFTLSGAYERVAEYTGLTKEAIEAELDFAKKQYDSAEAVDKASEALAKKSGRNAEEIKAVLEFAQDATDAATKVKTFTQLWDVMKESAQSGWAQTWKLVIGDFEMAKNLLTPLADFFVDIIGKMSDARNNLLESALGKGFSHMFEGIDSVLNKVGNGVESVLAPVDKAAESLEKLDTIVNDVIRGSFGNGKERFDALTKAGQNYYLVQNKINEKLGSSVRHSEEKIKAQDELLKQQGKVTEAAEGEKKATLELDDAQKKKLKTLVEMSDAQLKNAGYSEQQIDALRELEEQATKLGLPVGEFIDNLDQINGRWLLFNSFKNVGLAIVEVFKSMGAAWSEIFDPITGDQIYGIIAGLHKLTSYLRVNEDAADAFKRTFKGVFAALDIILTIVGGPIKIAFKLFAQLLEACNVNIFEVTAIVGDAIVKFHDWLDSVLDFTGVFKWLAPYVIEAYEAISKWVSNINFAEIFSTLGELAVALGDYIYAGLQSIKNNEIVQDLMAGFVLGFKDGAKAVWNAVVNFAKTILEKIKNVLGIHSPSQEFYDIAKMCIQGFVDGIVALGSLVLDGVWSLFKKVVDLIKEIDLGTVISTAISVGAIAGFIKLANALDAIAAPFEGFGEVLEGLEATFKGLGKKFKSEAVKNFAISVAILAASVAVLAFTINKYGWDVALAVGAIAAIAGIMVAMSWAISKFGSAKPTDALKFGAFVLILSTALLMLAGVMAIVGTMKPETLERAGTCFLVFGAVVAAMMASTKLASGKRLKQIGPMIMQVSVAMLLLAWVARIVGGMTWGEMAKAAIGILGFVGLVSALVYVSTFADKNVGKIGGTILKIAGALLLIVWISSLLNGMEWSELGKAAVGILSLVGVVAALIYVSTYAGYYSDNAGVVLKLAGAITLLALAGKIIASMSWGDMGKAVVGIAGLAAVIAGLIAATKLATDKELKKVSSTLLVMTICIALLAGITVILGLVDLATLAKGVTAVAILGAVVAGMTYATTYAGDAKGAMIGIAVAIFAMVAAVAALSFIDPKKLAVAVTAMTILMGALALVVKSAGMVYGATGPLIVMTVAIALLGGILYGLAQLPTESSLEAALALSAVLLALAGALRILARVDRTVKDALKAVLALTAMAVPLFAFSLVLDRMSATENAVQNALALSVLIGVVSLLMTPLAAIGTVAANAAIGVALLTSVAVPLFVFVGVLRRMEGLEDSIKNAAALSLLILGMSVTLGVLAIIGPMAAGALAGIASLTLFIGAIGGLMIAIGALSDAWPDLEYFLDTGIGLLNKLGHGIGSFVGNLFSGFADGATNGLPEIGKRLTDFMTNAQGFIDGVKNVDETVATGVGVLAKAILAITAADLISSVASFYSSGSSLADLGNELSEFMVNAAPFLYGMKNVDPAILGGVESLANAIMALTAANVIDGLTSWLVGDVSLSEFGSELALFGPSMKQYADAVAGIDSKSVQASADAAKSLAEMAAALPNSGGLSGLLAGENDMSAFGEQLGGFGKAMKTYSLCVSGLDVEAIELSVDAAKGLSELATSIPNFGGLVSFFTGENDLVTFGAQLTEFGRSIKIYSIMVSGLNVESISTSITAAKKLGEMASAIPNVGGLVTFFTGDNNIATFGAQLVVFGQALKNYAIAVEGIDAEAIAASVTAGSALSDLANALPESGGVWSIFSADNDMSTFGSEIVSFGSAIKRYSNAVSGIDIYSIRASITAAKDIVKLINGLSDLDASGIGGFSEAMESLGRVSMTKFVYAFKDRSRDLVGVGDGMITSITAGIQKAQPRMLTTTKNLVEYMYRSIESQNSKFKIAGMMLITQLKLGIIPQTTGVKMIITAPIISALAAINGYYTSFYSAGKNMAKGLADGINAGRSGAIRAASNMASSALKAARDELGIQSPSKEFYAVGEYSGLGFINALFAYAKKAYNAGAEIGDSATSGVSEAISRIKYALDENVDIQPTISPVLDLSDIKNGANAINGLLDGTPLNASLGSISTAMNRRNQNGTTNDVVYAINKLRKDLSELDRNSYNIGNVSYEEGSDVANAIQTLVRAAVRERRV